MKFEYRQVIIGFELSKKEAQTLKDAEKILLEADKKLCNVDGTEIEKDLSDIIRTTALNLGQCNAKLNVNITLEE